MLVKNKRPEIRTEIKTSVMISLSQVYFVNHFMITSFMKLSIVCSVVLFSKFVLETCDRKWDGPMIVGGLSLCQRLGLTRSVRNKPRALSASIERRRRESPPEEAKDSLRSSFAGGARGFAEPLHHEGANTIFLTNKKLSLDKRLQLTWYGK